MTEEFAANRAAAMSRLDHELLPVVRAALAHYEAGTAWYAPIVDKALELGGDAVDASLLRETLAHTRDPENTAGDTDERVAQWVSTYIVNATEHDTGDETSFKTWITREDDRVRHTHALLDGKTIPQGDTFQVGDERLRYPGEPVGDPSVWINCRCILRVTKGADMSLGVDNTMGSNFTVSEATVSGLAADLGPNTDGENVIPKPDPADMPASDPSAPAVDENVQVPFHGVATVTGKKTGDGRQLAPDGFSHRPLPLPLFYQRAQGDGHAGSTIVGQLTKLALVGDEVQYDGVFNFTPEAGEAIQGVAEGWLRGVSVDLDDVVIDMAQSEPAIPDGATDAEIATAVQTAVTVFSQWRVSGLTMVGIPAFYQAYIALGPRPTDAATPAPAEPAAAATASATFAPGTHDGPGWITAPIPTGRIRRYWTHGEGAAKIKWGVPGDFNRCRSQLAKYIANQDWLAGACANMHKEATGGWPGHAPTEASIVEQGALMASAFNLVASAAAGDLPPVEWFQNPNLSGPTPITIEGDRIFGHIATWGTCHLGMPGMCTEAPHSNTNYSWFRLGAVETDAGLVPVGQITMDSGHADLKASATNATAHYDNTATAVADIAAGEDAYGIWFSGRVRPGLHPDKRAALLAAKLSGDWRRIQGNLELVAALAVNTPGFGIPRLALAASGAEQTALVAAGIVDETPAEVGLTLAQEIERIIVLRERRAALADTTARLRELAATRRHARVEAAKKRLGR